MPGQSFDRVAAIYDDTRGGQRRGDSVARSIAPWITGERVVEAGVGTGVVAVGLRSLGHEVVGFDLSAQMLRVAVGRIGRRVAIADADRLPLPASSVDTIIFVWVLQLVRAPSDTLAEAARTLRPGGRAVAVLSATHDHPDDEIGQLLKGLGAALRPGRDRESIVAAAPSTLRVDHSDFTAWDEFPDTAEVQIDMIEKRGYSSLFDLDQATWTSVVEPVLAALRALPDTARSRRRKNRHPLIVWTKT